MISINEDEGNGMDDTDIENYANGISEQSLGLTFRINAAISTIGSDSNEQFVIDYMSPISTVVAVIVCLLLVTFCIDIGIRSVKLAFLQLIYPIPVLSYMDPKSGKDGMFSKWYKMCFSTFLSLFIRLLALYFGLYIISRIGSVGLYDVVNGSQITNGWVMIFIIIGVLMFVKQLPKILENLGIKIEGDGKFTLNPLKKAFDENNGMFGAKRIAGAAGGFAVGAMHGRALRGLASGAMSGKGFGEAAKQQADYVSKLREARMNGSTFGGRMGARFAKATGFGGASARLAKQDKRLENDIQHINDQVKQQENSIADRRDAVKRMGEVSSAHSNLKSKMIDAIKNNKAGSVSKQYKKLQDAASFAEAKKNNLSRDDYYEKDEDGNRVFNSKKYDADLRALSTAAREAQEAADIYLNKKGLGEFYDTMRRTGTSGESDIDAARDALDNVARQNAQYFDEANPYNPNSSYADTKGVLDGLDVRAQQYKDEIYSTEQNIDALNRRKSEIEEDRNSLRDRKSRADSNKF